jgi:hypothetical protein
MRNTNDKKGDEPTTIGGWDYQYASKEGFVLTHFLTVTDVKRSADPKAPNQFGIIGKDQLVMIQLQMEGCLSCRISQNWVPQSKPFISNEDKTRAMILPLTVGYYNIFYDLLIIVYCASQCRVVTYVQE